MVVARKVDPRGTRFRALRYEDHATLLQQEIQGVGQHPEAVVSYELEEETNKPQEDIEVTNAHHGSPVQIKVFPEDQTTQESGALLYQQSQLLMKWMQDNPHPTISPKILVTIQRVSTEPRNPSLTTTDRTNGSGNPESTIFPIDLSIEGTTQLETGRVSIETQAPNPLSTLIHTYNDDETRKPSYGTLVHIQE
jgi:hypothetical protein